MTEEPQDELDDLLDDYLKDTPTPEELKKRKEEELRKQLEEEEELEFIRRKKLQRSLKPSEISLPQVDIDELRSFLKNAGRGWETSGGNPTDDIKRLLRSTPGGVNVEGALRPAFIELALLEKLEKEYPLRGIKAVFKNYKDEADTSARTIHTDASYPQTSVKNNDWTRLDYLLHEITQQLVTGIRIMEKTYDNLNLNVGKFLTVYSNHEYSRGGHLHVNIYKDSTENLIQIQAWLIYEFKDLSKHEKKFPNKLPKDIFKQITSFTTPHPYPNPHTKQKSCPACKIILSDKDFSCPGCGALFNVTRENVFSPNGYPL